MPDYILEEDDRVVVMNACLMNLPGTANLIGRGRTTCVALLEALENAGYVVIPNPANDPVAQITHPCPNDTDGDGDCAWCSKPGRDHATVDA